jgi:small subunit ribosomal protein S16
MGAKKAPFYRIVVADVRKPMNGAVIEEIGYYDPTKNPYIVKIDLDAVDKWVKLGAQPTETVRDLIRKERKALAQ